MGAGGVVAVRVLFSFVGGTGHFLPTLPVARALADRGHEVRYTCQGPMIRTVERTGFSAVDSGGLTLLDPNERRQLVPVDRSAEAAVMRDVFAGRFAAERGPRVRDVAAAMRADVVVHDEADFGAAAAAAVSGLPSVPVTVMAAGGFITEELVGDRLVALSASLGDQVTTPSSLLAGAMTVTPVMPSFRDPRYPLPADTCFVQPAIVAGGSAPVGDDGRFARWIAARPAEPLVYFTLGTIFHQESGDLFGRVIGALAHVPASVLVTVGREIDPAELPPPPPNVLIERFVPNAAVLPHSRVVVCHGGSGTTVDALAMGVPLVVLPMGADQPDNADRCADLGVARVLDPMATDTDEIAATVTDVLNDPSYREAAAVLRQEARAMPPATTAATRIESL